MWCIHMTRSLSNILLNNMRLYTHIAITILLLYASSCSKTAHQAPNRGSAYTNFNAFLDQPANGIFGIQSYSSMIGQSGTRSCLIGGSFHDASWNGLPGGPVSIGDIMMHDTAAGSSYQYGLTQPQPTTMYGSTVVFSINPNPDGDTTGANATASLYIPQLVSLSSPGLHDTISAGGHGIPATVFSWNADPLDTTSVTLTFDYDPTNPLNTGLAASYPSKIVNVRTLHDKGSYVFQTSDAADFPPNSWIDVTLTRPNYAKIHSADGTKTYLIFAFNAVQNTFYYSP